MGKGSLGKWMMKILVILAVLVVAAIVLDWLAGKVIAARTSGERVSQYWRMKILAEPYIMTKLGEDQSHLEGVTCTINEQGFRHDGPVPVEKTRPRIFVIGGSVALGVGALTDDSTYLAQMQKRFPDIEFINAGGPSYISNQQWIDLALNIYPLQPDGIIILDGFNDLAIPVAYGDAPGNPYLWDTYRGLLSGSLGETLWAHIRMKSNINRVVSRVRICRYANSSEFEEEVLPKVIDQYLHGSSVIYTMCRARNLKVWHVLQPQLATKKTRTEIEEKYMYGPFTEAMTKYYPHLVDAAREQAAEEHVPFLDLSAAFADVEESVFVDFCHVNDLGQEMFAKMIGDFLEKEGLDEIRTGDL